MFVEHSSIRAFAAPILNGKRASARFSLRMGAANDEWVRGAANDEWVQGAANDEWVQGTANDEWVRDAANDEWVD